MAKVLITGARGMLGRRLVEVFSKRHQVVATAHTTGEGFSTLDIADAAQVRTAVAHARPDWIVNAAAYTAVDKAESDAASAERANVLGPEVLARAAFEFSAVLLHVSTDYVFGEELPGDRIESDPVSPVGVYARTKEQGERRVRQALDRHVILRVAWLFGADGKNFVDTMLRLGREKDRLRVVQDQRGTPTYTNDAAALALRILEAGIFGTIHGANQNPTTWFDFAQEALRLAGIGTRIDPILTAEYPTPAARPKNSALRNRVLEETMGNSMRPWQDALAEYLRVQ